MSTRTRLIRRVADAARQDLDACVAICSPASLETIRHVRVAIGDALDEITNLAGTEGFLPSLPLRLAQSDPEASWPQSLSQQRQRVGFIAITGNPIHWGHIYQALRAIPRCGLHAVIVQVLGDHPHKRHTKISKVHRHRIAQLSLQPFYPLLRYTPLGCDTLTVGEASAAELVLLNYDLPLEVCFIAEGDARALAARHLEACRALLAVMDTEETRPPELQPILTGAVFRGDDEPEIEALVERYRFLQAIARDFALLGVSSTMFRADPSIPLLPMAGFDYIHEQGLYGTVNASGGS